MSVIHPTAIIHPGVTLGECSFVGPWCELGGGEALVIGNGAVIRSHTTIYGGSEYGPGLETGHHVLLRSDNSVGENLRIGSYSSLEGGGVVGDYVRIHGRCEMTKGTLKHFSRVYGGTYITDNRLPPSNVNEHAVLDEGSVVCMNCVVIAGVRVGVGAFVGASTVISKDVPDGFALIGGKLKLVTALNWKDYSYPWTGYYQNAYPVEAQPRIRKLHERILAAASGS